jgi:hypothetical protein
MKIEQSINNRDSWRVTDDGGSYELGYIIRATGAYQAFGAKLHHGKGGMRKKLGPFQTLDEAGRAIEESHSK